MFYLLDRFYNNYYYIQFIFNYSEIVLIYIFKMSIFIKTY